jgi:hypothetical protein
MTVRYNLKNIRALLTEGFTDRELRRLCYDVSEFKPVYDQLAEFTGKVEIIDRLVEYAEQKLQLETLLAHAQERNPGRYERHKPYYDKIMPLTQTGVDKTYGSSGKGPTSSTGAEAELLDERISLKSELIQRRRNLNVLREQAAIFAAGETPLHLINQIEAEKIAVQTIQDRLSELKDEDG